MNKVRVAIVGASGYSGEELVRLLLDHPQADLTTVTSRQYAGRTVAQVFPRFAHRPRARALVFREPDVAQMAAEAEVIFLALPHGVAAEFARPLLAANRVVIDLSADFRLRDPAVYEEFYGHTHPAPELLGQAVYGLPELHREAIRRARLIASPGCYPTSILLPLVPLLRAGLIEPDGIVVNSLSGVSGAGRKAESEYLFCECAESLRAYGVPKHRHLSEIEQELSLAAGQRVRIQFTPHLVPVRRGILTTIVARPRNGLGTAAGLFVLTGRIQQCYQAWYGSEPFVRVLDDKTLPDTKNVVGTNVCEIGWRLDTRTGHLVVISAEDNLLKGASGQAVQSMNLVCGFPETTGLG
ncbi:MAG: N-acetyl-gamma-glutamyl-phosphate reductase [Verrucomicrobiota bacterium]|nr:N-acetyl-gamma-glutamyl-phosphate reductase [Limisphaera sp.]MDW8383070.1 N-acetyl-gamma-glutamyl-phosphate reductase [Verrucomicrobiota bacterium]